MKSMKFEKILATTTLTGALLSGCSAQESLLPTPSPSPSVTESSDDFFYDATPEDNFSVTDCRRDRRSWAVSIDTTPKDAKSDSARDHTIGVTGRYEKNQPVLETGAKVRSLGNLAYRVTTAADALGESTVVDLGEKSYSRVLRAGDGYDAVFSLHLGKDGHAYSTINCLPETGFQGDTPSTPVPLSPPSTPAIVSPGRSGEVRA